MPDEKTPQPTAATLLVNAMRARGHEGEATASRSGMRMHFYFRRKGDERFISQDAPIRRGADMGSIVSDVAVLLAAIYAERAAATCDTAPPTAPPHAAPPMTVEQALELADTVTPAPAVAHEALKALRAEVHLRWEQRTALSFRLQDLRTIAAGAGIPDDSPLYGAIHDATATAEAWMHPGTLSEAAATHLARLKKQLAANPPPMSEERADRINNICVQHFFFAQGLLPEAPAPLGDLTLADMVAARDLVHGRGQRTAEEGGSIVPSTCDDRFLAALYCAAHYDGTDSTEAIDVIAAVADGRAAAVLKTDPTRYLRASA